jgi:23S rRNA-/tRNA-specific pseudouridylate synthase
VSRLADNFWETLPLGRGVTLLTRDANGLAALSKPAGILSHPNEPRDQPRSLLHARYEQDGEYFEWQWPAGAVAGAGDSTGTGENLKSQIPNPKKISNPEIPNSKTANTLAPPPAPLATSAPPTPPSPAPPLDTCHLPLATSAPPPPAPPPASSLATCHLLLATSAPPARRLWLLNRLDSATSGVILVAADESLAREIRALFQRRHIHKTYAALVFGAPSENRQHWADRLAIEKRRGQIRANAAAGHIPAEARMTLLRSNRSAARPLSLIQLEPKTGRSHQLRVQCARRRLPIVGDATYGDFRANRDFAKRTGEKRLFLHSLETRFDYEHAGRVFAFAARAGLPEAFEAALRP